MYCMFVHISVTYPHTVRVTLCLLCSDLVSVLCLQSICYHIHCSHTSLYVCDRFCSRTVWETLICIIIDSAGTAFLLVTAHIMNINDRTDYMVVLIVWSFHGEMSGRLWTIDEFSEQLVIFYNMKDADRTLYRHTFALGSCDILGNCEWRMIRSWWSLPCLLAESDSR